MFWVGFAVVMGCHSSTSTENVNEPDPVWHGDLQPWMVQNCTNCHRENGSAPFSFESLEVVQQLAPVMLESMKSGSMPPWLPSDECAQLEEVRSVDVSEIARFERWIELGFPIGDADVEPAVLSVVQDIEADYIAQLPPGFVPDTSAGDEYRCFPLELNFETETFIRETQVKPGNSLVHHVLIYALDPSQKESVLAADAASERPGYKCFGAPFPDGGGADYSQGFPAQIGAWVPGIEPAVLPDGAAFRVKPGSLIVMQVHYSALGGEPVEDTTSYHIRVSSDPPAQLAQTRPLAILELDIPPGASSVSVSDRFTNYFDRPAEIYNLATHMHLLGKSQQATITRSDGSEECALYIPEWDFGWQQSYEPKEPMILEPGESIHLDCTYDNSQANQPLVNGTQQAPQHVEWGDGTLDEMCLLYVTFMEPYRPLNPEGSSACHGVEECVADCGDSLDCLMQCESVEFGCLTCALGSFLDCGISQCLVEGAMAESCMRHCYARSIMLGAPIGACMDTECPSEYSALMECAEPAINGAQCEAQFASCGL